LTVSSRWLSVGDGDWLRTLWESDRLGARVARAALMPAELLFHAVSASRAALYSSGVFDTHPTAVPALSVGNLTVGGTGKTPLAAYLARRLSDAGATPAIVLRGYGDDEPLVHRTLNPDIQVVVSPDRVAGSIEARGRGCDVVVLDDAFQHRQASRVADVVLISADRWHGRRRHLLPAGPWRERLTAASRASLVIVTRKAASLDRASAVIDALKPTTIRTAVVNLDPGELRDVSGSATVDLRALRDARVLAICAIGDPAAFEAQLSRTGARVDVVAFRDHHRYSAADVAALTDRAVQYDRVVCTLKDAVKLGPLWQAASPLWYVSQRVVVERGGGAVDDVISTTLLARSASIHSRRSGPP
jgi:tetraacyldisaccharide 4'-kinase